MYDISQIQNVISYREMSLVVVGEMSEKIIGGDQLQDCVTKKLQRLIVTAVQQQKQRTIIATIHFLSFVANLLHQTGLSKV